MGDLDLCSDREHKVVTLVKMRRILSQRLHRSCKPAKSHAKSCRKSGNFRQYKPDQNCQNCGDGTNMLVLPMNLSFVDVSLLFLVSSTYCMVTGNHNM